MNRRSSVIIVIFAVLLMACGSPRIKPVCRHTAAFAALTYGEIFPVRIAIGPSDLSDRWHAQAQAQIDGDWVWLETGQALITPGHQDAFTPSMYMDLDRCFDWLTRSQL